MAQDSQLDAVRAALASRYAVEREIGRGGMATVYLARDLQHGRPVAIKVLRPEIAAALGPSRFVREIRIASSLTHPHIVAVHDSGDAGGLLYYVMAYLEGESLRQRLVREKQLPLADAIGIACQVAGALDAAHERGIIHRDIKPANILLHTGHAIVADFGIARAIEAAAGDEITSSGLAVGTAGYMSPEQAAGSQQLDARTDLYSLGCVLYEMLAGEPPYTGASAQAVVAKQLSLPVPSVRTLRETVPPAVDDVARRALAKAPADRFATAGEFATALQDAARRGSLGQRLRGDYRRAARLALGGAVAVVAAGLIWQATVTPGGPESGPDPRHIAVLYFDDLSPDKALGHVAAGLTEDLIDRLSQVRVLSVISPNGVRPYQGRATPVDSVARALAVGTIVGGSVARSGERVRVRVRLIDGPSGKELYSSTLEQPWSDPFTLQDRLGAEVSEFLRQRVGQEIRSRTERAGTKSLSSWELTQRAHELRARGATLVRTGDSRQAETDLLSADSLLNEAGRLDPAWIVPMVERGWVAFALSFVSPGPGPAGESLSPSRAPPARQTQLSPSWLLQGITYAERALERRPGAPEALALRGDLRYTLATSTAYAADDSVVTLAEVDLETALAARPDLARGWYRLADLYARVGRFGDASRAAHNALEADPYLSEVRSVYQTLFNASLDAERFDDARSWCRQGLDRFTGDPRFAECELRLLAETASGRDGIAAAWRALSSIEQRDSVGLLSQTRAFRRLYVAAVLARSGMGDSARAVIGQARALQAAIPSGDMTLIEAYVRLLLGEREAALRLVAGHLRARPEDRAYVARIPWYRVLRTSPEFRALVQPYL